ncbi:TPA: hypothetical protein ACGXEK_005917, partial [Pseudomonas aeruginosa]
RREDLKSNGSRRPRATHFIPTGDGHGTPQAFSTRGKVFAYINEHCTVGEPVEIESFGEKVAHLLYGTSVRSYLSKLEIMGWVDLVAIASKEDEAGQGDDEKADEGQEHDGEGQGADGSDGEEE